MGGTAVVVGAGPVGSLSAAHLAAQGWDVHVLEKRGRLQSRPSPDDDRAYCMMVNPRGTESLLAAGMDLSALAESANGQLSARMFAANGKTTGIHDFVDPLKPKRILVYRDELSDHLLKELQRLQPSVHVHMGAQVEHIDLDKQQVSFSQGSQPAEVLRYDLLVGADGAGSVVRKTLAEVMPPGFCQLRVADARVTMGPLPSAGLGTKTHAAVERHDFEAGGILWSDRGDGDRRVTVNITKLWADRVRQNPAALDAIIDDRKKLPQLPEHVREGAKALLHSRPDFRVLFRWIICNELVGRKVVLLGDAAHSMSPHLGQACNCGLEDAHIFAGVLKACGGSVDAALQQYNKERLPDVQALLAVNQMWSNKLGMRQEGLEAPVLAWMTFHRLLITLVLIARMIPHKLAPSIFPQPTFMQCMLGTRPYRHIFSEAYLVLAAIAGVCVIPLLRVMLRQ